jgi:hypothetical protein
MMNRETVEGEAVIHRLLRCGQNSQVVPGFRPQVVDELGDTRNEVDTSEHLCYNRASSFSPFPP